MYVCMYVCIYISIYISTDTCFAVPQLISVQSWYNLDMAWQLFIAKWLSVTTACGTIAVMRTSRERKAIWGPECSNYQKGSGLCIIAKGHPRQLHRVLNNTEMTELYSYIYIQLNYIYIYIQLIYIYSAYAGHYVYYIYIYSWLSLCGYSRKRTAPDTDTFPKPCLNSH